MKTKRILLTKPTFSCSFITFILFSITLLIFRQLYLIRDQLHIIATTSEKAISAQSHTDSSVECPQCPQQPTQKQSLTPYSLCRTKWGDWMAVIRNDFVSDQIAIHGVWEQLTTDFFSQYIKPGEVVVELGGNIGYFTVLLARGVGMKGKVYSYECNPEVFEVASLSLRMNHMEDIVDHRNLAVSNESTLLNFHRETVAQAADHVVNIGGSHIDPHGEFVVRSVRLDDDLPSLRNVDWIKMDIEGSEILALLGAKRIVESSPRIKIVLEWNPSYLRRMGSDLSQVLDEYERQGFQFFSLSTDGLFKYPLNKQHLIAMPDTDMNFLIARPFA